MSLTIHTEPPTSHELWLAYRAARLRYSGISLLKALNTPSLFKSLSLHVEAMRKKQQHGQPAPMQRAA